jgi:hypothetical protein
MFNLDFHIIITLKNFECQEIRLKEAGHLMYLSYKSRRIESLFKWSQPNPKINTNGWMYRSSFFQKLDARGLANNAGKDGNINSTLLL